MTVLYNLAKVATATTGTGTITLGSALSGFLTFAQAGVSDGEVVSYGIRDGANSEVGTGTYTASGTTLTRTVTKSTNSNNPISLSGSAEVYITARSEDIVNKTGDVMTGALTLLNTGLKVQDTDASHTLSIVPGTNLTADRILTLTTGDASRNITLTGNTTIPAFLPTSSVDNTLPRFDGTAGSMQTSGVVVDDSNNMSGVALLSLTSIDVGNADTTITRSSSGVIAVEGSNVLMASNIGGSVQGYSANLNALSTAFTAQAATTAASLNFSEATNNGTNKISLVAPVNITTDKVATFQDVTGTIYVTGGSDVSVSDGGTGLSTLTANAVLLGNGTSALQTVSPSTNGNVLTSNGTTWVSSAPTASGVSSISFGSTGLTPSTATTGAISVAGTLGVSNGGTGTTTSTGSGNNVLSNSPTLVTPVLGTPSSGTLTNCSGLPLTGTTGTLAINRGGTGLAPASYTNGQLLIGNGTGFTAATLTQGTGVTITNGAGSITISSSASSSGPAFGAYLSSINQVLSNGVYVKLQMETEEFDTDGAFNTTSYRFTVPSGKAGVYQFNAGVNLSPSGGGLVAGLITLYKNGAVIKNGTQINWNSGASANVMGCTVSAILQLIVGDYVEAYGLATTSTGVYSIANKGAGATYFNGSYIRA